MARHMSNADRIAKAAAEVEAGTKEKAAKAKTKAPAKPKAARAPKAPPRMKIIWAVGKPGAVPTATFPYAQRAAADAQAAKSGGGAMVSALRVPMEPGE